MSRKLMTILATALVSISGFVGGVIDRATRGHPEIRGALYSIENEATKIIRSGFPCGIERWSVKTMSDSAASSINTVTPTATNIPHLRAFPVPASFYIRNSPVETTDWKLTNTKLVAYKEELDSDIHLKLQSTIDGTTMIAEIPDPNCVSSPLERDAIATMRVNFIKEVGTPTGYYQTVNDVVTLEGVGFFDFVHGQNGVAPNGIELHPVLKFVRIK